MTTAIVHDYLTQRGGAERVVLSLSRALPDAPIYTSLYDPHRTFPEFQSRDVRPMKLNGIAVLRRHHRLGLPVFASAFSRLAIDADNVICSSSGWAHGTRVGGRKVVYCHTPARWLYQSAYYLGGSRRAAALSPLRPLLVDWDRRAAATADLYLVNSSAVRDRVRSHYGINAEILPPPPSLDPDGAQTAPVGLQPGFFLCVARLLPYKNVGAVVAAFASSSHRLVVAGSGPLLRSLPAGAPPNVRFVGEIPDTQLRWLYMNACAVVSASREDFGLSPLEGASFGKPSLVLRYGGFLDTVIPGATGEFFPEATPDSIASALACFSPEMYSPEVLRHHAIAFAERQFIARIRSILGAEPLSPAPHPPQRIEP